MEVILFSNLLISLVFSYFFIVTVIEGSSSS